MADYRDPKVTETNDGGGMGKWIGILIAGLVALLLLAWLLGWFDGPEVAEVEAVEPVAVETVETEPVVVPEEAVEAAEVEPVLIDEAEEVGTESANIIGETPVEDELIELDTDVEVVEN